MYRVSSFIRHFAWALLAGTALATLLVNLAPEFYYDLIERRLFSLSLPSWLAPAHTRITLIWLVSEVLMALFLFFLGKELWEAHMLERGALRGHRSALPLLATAGGLIGAAIGWVGLSALFQTAEEAGPFTGWAVPLGSDVVLGYLVGRAVFGAQSSALHMLLLVLIGADLAALLALGLVFPANPLRLVWLLLPLAASVGAWALVGRKAHRGASERERQAALHLWPYVIAGALSWLGVVASGLPGALGLLPVIPAIPHADRAFGLFAEAEEFLHDPLNRLAHLLVTPLIVVLALFGFTRGGIDLLALAPTTWITLGALWLGKPAGILAGTIAAVAVLRLPLPAGMTLRDVALMAGIAGMGFTVPVLALETGLPGGAMAEAARLGLALSLLAGPAMILVARATRRA